MGSPVVQDIIFKVGSTGAAAATSKFKGLSVGMMGAAAAVVGVAIEVNKLRQHLNVLSSQYSRLSGSQREAVTDMRAATKGMMDMGTAMKVSGTLAASGIKDQKTALVGIAKIVYETGSKLGETTEEMEGRMRELTQQISEGAVDGLKKYGIQLTATGNLQEDQKMAVEALTSATKGITVSYENTDNALEALSNATERYIALQHNMLTEREGEVSFWNMMQDVFGSFAESIDEATTAQEKYYQGIKTLRESGASDHLVDKFKEWNSALERNKQMLADGEGDRDKLLDYIDDLQGRMDDITSSADAMNKAFDEAGKTTDRLLDAGFFDAWGVVGESSEQGSSVDTSGPSTGSAKKKGKKTGGGVKEKKEQIDFNKLAKTDEVEQIKLKIAAVREKDEEARRLAKDKRDREYELIKANEKKVSDEADRVNALDNIKDQTIKELEEEQKKLDELGILGLNAATLKADAKYESDMTEQQAEAEHQRVLIDLQEQAAKAKHDIIVADTQATLALTGNMFGQLAGMQDKESKKGFKVAKGFAVAQAGVNTALAAIKSYQSLAGIPIVGPALGAVAAGVAVAAGAVQIKKIKEQEYGGGGSTAAPSGVSGKDMASLAGAGDYGNAGGGEGGGQIIENTIILDGEILHRGVMSVNDNANQQGQRSFGTVEG